MSRTSEETKDVFIKGAERLTMALQEVPAVAKCSLLSQTTIDISQRKTKRKYLQLFMCWVKNLPASEKQTSDVKKSKAMVPSVRGWNCQTLESSWFAFLKVVWKDPFLCNQSVFIFDSIIIICSSTSFPFSSLFLFLVF